MVRRNVQPDTALDWSAVAELAGTSTITAPVKPPATYRPPVSEDTQARLTGHHHEGGGHHWPATLDGLGVKKVGAFKECLWCGGTGTWVRYAGLPTCLTCASSWPETRTQDGARVYLWRLLDTWAGMDESAWLEANVKALYEDIMDIFGANPEAEVWFKEWREAHPEGRLV